MGLCAATGLEQVHLNGERLPVKDFSNYVDMYLKNKSEPVKIYEKVCALHRYWCPEWFRFRQFLRCIPESFAGRVSCYVLPTPVYAMHVR